LEMNFGASTRDISRMTEKDKKLSAVDDAKLVMDFFHRHTMHHAMWFMEVAKRLGKDKAYSALSEVYDKSMAIQIKRLAKTMGFELIDGVPEPLVRLSDKERADLKESLGVNWLANDGIWFQAVEFTEDMTTAKECNDACWAEFSPLEAWSIKKLLDLGDNTGLKGLKLALEYRFYAFVNKQSITDETDTSFIFRMNDCRIQSARKRKGLDDYPCKSAGIVEYTTFAGTIDSGIKTSCIGCPPDKHPEEWYCSWKFSI
jgi:hypothetical protein